MSMSRERLATMDGRRRDIVAELRELIGSCVRAGAVGLRDRRPPLTDETAHRGLVRRPSA